MTNKRERERIMYRKVKTHWYGVKDKMVLEPAKIRDHKIEKVKI